MAEHVHEWKQSKVSLVVESCWCGDSRFVPQPKVPAVDRPLLELLRQGVHVDPSELEETA